MTDQEALQRYAARRDPDAFSRLVRSYQHLVYAAAWRHLGRAEDVEDATQQTFLRLARHARSIQSDVGAWLHRCATNVAIDMIRRDTTRKRHERAYAEVAPLTDAPDVDWPEISRRIDEAILELDETDRALVVGVYLAGQAQRDVAEQVGLSQATVSRRLAKAVDRLRNTLAQRGVVAPAAGLAAVLASLPAQAQAPAALTAELTKVGLAGVGAAGGAGGVGVGLGVKLAAGVALAAAVAGGVIVATRPGAPTGPAVNAGVVTQAAPDPDGASRPPGDELPLLRDATPLLDERAVAVASVDLTRADPAASLRWLIDTLQQSGVPAAMAKQMQGAIHGVQRWQEAALDLGVNRLGVVMRENAERPDDDDIVPVVFAPLAPDVDAAALARFLGIEDDRWLIHDGRFVGLVGPDEWNPLETAIPKRPRVRPELADAARHIERDAAWLIFAPTPGYRRGMLERFAGDHEEPPVLHAPVEAAAMDLATILYEARWAIVCSGGDAPSVLKTQLGWKDEQAAADARRRMAEAVEGLPDRDGFLNGRGADFPARFMLGVFDEIVWQTAGSCLIGALDPAAIDWDRFTPLWIVAQEDADRVRRMSDARQLALGVIVYVNDHKDWPKSLDDTAEAFGGLQQLKALRGRFVYVPPAGDFRELAEPAKTILLAERRDDGRPSVVVFADGHAEVLTADDPALQAFLQRVRDAGR